MNSLNAILIYLNTLGMVSVCEYGCSIYTGGVMDELLIKKHSFYKYADQVNEFCKDLFSSTPINYFCIGRAYRNGDYGGLLSDKGWAYHYLKNDFQQLGVEHQLASQHASHFFWNLTNIKPICQKSKAMYDAAIQFKRGSGVIFVASHLDYNEACLFTTSNDVYSNDPFLAENINLLKRFILFFKEYIYNNSELFAAFSKRYKNELSTPQPTNIYNSYQMEIVIKKYYLGGLFDDIAFSRREAECLKHISQGKTAKQIARILKLSPRTVETHINNIKLKANCLSLHELLGKLEKCQFLEVI